MTFAPRQYRSRGCFLFCLRTLSVILLAGLVISEPTTAESSSGAAATSPPPSPKHTVSAPSAARSSLPAVTFGRDVAPIVYGSCASCHRPGESGPFSLLSYEDVRKHAHQIVKVTQSRIMPPWLPEAGYGDFAEARRLTDDQIRTIARWVEQGSVLGPPADVPAAPEFPADWKLGPPDLLVEAPVPLDIPPAGPEIYWNFLLKPGLTATRYVRALEIHPGNRRIVHHANLLIDRTQSAQRMEKTPGAGFPGMDLTISRSVFDPEGQFLFWSPGGVPLVEPDGFAWRLDPGNVLVLNMHLRPSGKAEQVRPVVALYFTDKKPAKFPIVIQMENDPGLDVPAGRRDFLVADDFKLPLDADLLALYPHAHYLGRLMEVYATLPGGERRWLLRIPDWNLSWQSVFRYREPVFLPKGSVISMRYHYDNSEANPRNPNHPPIRARGGNHANDEMAHLWLQILPRGSGDRRRVVEEAIMQHRVDKYSDDSTARLNLGVLRLARLDPQAAVPVLLDAVRISPDDAECRSTLGIALRAVGRSSEAIDQLQIALRIRPDLAVAQYNLGLALLQRGRTADAIDQFRKTAATYPTDTVVTDQLARALERRGRELGRAGDWDQASSVYQEWVSLKPKDPLAHVGLGQAFVWQGKLKDALNQFDAALLIDPSLQIAQENRAAVQQKMGSAP
jgi:tetratricopeptide (TPR) repeat protein/mono/diheme cytochrome c family protein